MRILTVSLLKVLPSADIMMHQKDQWGLLSIVNIRTLGVVVAVRAVSLRFLNSLSDVRNSFQVEVAICMAYFYCYRW